MHDATIAHIERWLRECARPSDHKTAEDVAADHDEADQNPDRDRPFWPYLESDDFWRE